MNDNWIPSDTLPPMKFVQGVQASNMSEYVLCLTDWGHMTVGYYRFNGKNWITECGQADELEEIVTHWRHLPPPPKLEEQ
jgi:hypothetical protein